MPILTAAHSDLLREEFVSGLVNAHAVEKQARQLIERQLDRVRDYPELTQRLREHLVETNAQEERLDRLLDRFNESRSVIKDAVMSLGANMSAMMHAAASDEILKNSMANAAFENYEAAAYESLIAMAEAGGMREAIDPLSKSLEEERAMGRWVHDNIPMLTKRYLELRAANGSTR